MSDFGIVLTAADILYNQIEQHWSNKGQYKLLGDRVRTLLQVFNDYPEAQKQTVIIQKLYVAITEVTADLKKFNTSHFRFFQAGQIQTKVGYYHQQLSILESEVILHLNLDQHEKNHLLERQKRESEKLEQRSYDLATQEQEVIYGEIRRNPKKIAEEQVKQEATQAGARLTQQELHQRVKELEAQLKEMPQQMPQKKLTQQAEHLNESAVRSYDVYISFRFAEAMEVARALRTALQQDGLHIFLWDDEASADMQTAASALRSCKLAVILGTATYGTRTTSPFTTYEELRFIIEQKKPFFLIKMCEQFQVMETRFFLPDTVAYYYWRPETGGERRQIPPALVQQIVQRFSKVAGMSPYQPQPLSAEKFYDAHIVLRFSEALDEAKAVKAALEARGLSVFLCDVLPGEDIRQTIIHALINCKLAVLFGTRTFGQKTASSFSTYEELRFIIEQKKPFFLIKMCEQFEVMETRFLLPDTVAYYPWQPKTGGERRQVPPGLVQHIMSKLANLQMSGAPPTPAVTASSRSRDSNEQVSTESEISAAIASLAGADGVRYDGVMCVSVGPGGTGKTALRLAIQDQALPRDRESTQGGDSQHLMVRLKQLQLVGFTVDNLSPLQLALLKKTLSTSEAKGGAEVPVELLAQLVEGVDDSQAKKHTPPDAPLQDTVGSDFLAAGHSLPVQLGLGSRISAASGQPSLGRSNFAASGQPDVNRSTFVGSGPTNVTTKRAPKVQPTPTAAPPRASEAPVPEELHFTRQEQATLLKRRDELQGQGLQEGVHITFFDMGGQPEFAAIAAEFLRNRAIITVVSRLDELKSNVLHKKKMVGDSDLLGLDELFIWLDAVAARTNDGPVLLVFSRLDEVHDAQVLQKISNAVEIRLQNQEHPVLSRLRRPPNSKLIFFAVDNTRGLKGQGIQLYRETVRQLAEEAPSVVQKVPVPLLRLQDALTGLTRKPLEQDTPSMRAIRERYREYETLHRITLTDFAQLYEAATGLALAGNLQNAMLRVYLNFFHMMGVVTHYNLPQLDNLIVIDPMWLLKQIVRVIRRPSLHPLEDCNVDETLAGKRLYEEGILEPGLLKKLWQRSSKKVQEELLALCLKDGLFAPLGSFSRQVLYLVPALVPSTGPSAAWNHGDQNVTIVYFAFYNGSPLTRFTLDYLRDRCSLPAGIFERLMAALTRLSFGSTVGNNEPVLSRRYARFFLGAYEVELKLEDASRMVSVAFTVTYARGLLQQVKDVVDNVLKQYYMCLKYEVLVPLVAEKFVQHASLEDFWVNRSQATMVIHGTRFSREEFGRRFASVLPHPPAEDHYHVFISYRRGKYPDGDTAHTSCFHNALSTHTIGGLGQAVSAFFDNYSLREAEEFDVAFMRAMSQTLVAVPFVTAAALHRMCEEGSVNELDNLLLEWWLALTLYEAKAGVKFIFPVVCGTITSPGTQAKAAAGPSIDDLFAELRRAEQDDAKQAGQQVAAGTAKPKLPLRLPTQVNQPTLAKLKKFVTKDLKLDAKIVEALTVKEIVDRLLKFNATSTLCWNVLGAAVKQAAEAGNQDKSVVEQVLLQQVFAFCAKAVVVKINEVLPHVQPTPSTAVKVEPNVQPTSRVTDGGAGVPVPKPASSVGPVDAADVGLASWLQKRQFQKAQPLLMELGIFSTLDLKAAVGAGDITLAQLDSCGLKGYSGKRFLKDALELKEE